MVAIFNDTRCYSEGACPFDPLLFTCTITGSQISFAVITLPTGQSVEIDQDDNIKENERLPSGVTLQDHYVMQEMSTVNYTLILAIERASLLTGTVTCSPGYINRTSYYNAECPVLTGKM